MKPESSATGANPVAETPASFTPPSREWLERMANLEDEAGSISVGGLASDLGLYVAPVAFAGQEFPEVHMFGADGKRVDCGCILTALDDGRHMVHVCEECQAGPSESDELKSLVETSRKFGSLVFIAGQDDDGRDLYAVAAATAPEHIEALRKIASDDGGYAIESAPVVPLCDRAQQDSRPVAETGALEPDAWLVEELEDGEWGPLDLGFLEDEATEFVAEMRERLEAAEEEMPPIRYVPLYRRAPSGETEGGV